MDNNNKKTINDVYFIDEPQNKIAVISDNVTKITDEIKNKLKDSKEITIPGTIKIIDRSCFLDFLSLEKVTLEYGITAIEDDAFFACTSLKSINIPDSVTTIGNCAFYDCTSLKEIDIPTSVQKIGDGAFEGCSSLESISIPFIGESQIKNKYFGFIFGAFDFNQNYSYVPKSLRRVTLKETCVSLENYSFCDCPYLEEIKMTSSISFVGYHVFSDSPSLKYNEYNNGYYLGNDENPYFIFIKLKSNDLTTISINENCEFINDDAFKDSSLKSIIIPDNVIQIGSSAFENCNCLEEITIPRGILVIDSFTFKDCISLEKINLPNNLTSIEYNAFGGCSSLKEIIIPKSVRKLADVAFEDCSSLGSIFIPSNVSNIGEAIFSGCSALESIMIDQNNIVYDSRDDCNAIINTSNNSLICGCKNTIIPNDILKIDKYAFCNCTTLESIIIPSKVVSIDKGAFMNSASLKNIKISPSVKSIDSYAFYNCISLESIAIPDSVITIGDNAFNFCKSLKTITISNNISSIDCDAFDNLKSIQYNEYENGYYLGSKYNPYLIFIKPKTNLINSFILNDNCKFLYHNCFYNCQYMKEFTIPYGIKSFGKHAFYNCSSLEEIDIPNSVEEIGNGAFYSCFSLKSMTVPFVGGSKDEKKYLGFIFENKDNTSINYLPKSLTKIIVSNACFELGNKAFNDCIYIESIYLPKNINRIGAYAFCNCNKLKNIYYKGTEEDWNSIYKDPKWDEGLNKNCEIIYNK